MPHSRFSFVNEAPSDPILGLTEEYKKDKNPSKVNLVLGFITTMKENTNFKFSV